MKSVTSATPVAVVPRRDLPVTVIGVAEQGRETGLGVEARQAQPVHRTVRADQRGRLHVADDGVVLDPACHVSSWLGGPCRYRTRRA
jgi:hypothetical protein